MKHKFFTIPIFTPEVHEAAQNQFFAQHSIANVEKHYDANNSVWVVCVTWLSQEGGLALEANTSANTRKPKVDYRETLSTEHFEQFSTLRNLRKALSEQEGVPVYNIFTNDQLAAMVQQRITTKTALLALEGVGQTRVEKYSAPFLQQVTQFVGQ